MTSISLRKSRTAPCGPGSPAAGAPDDGRRHFGATLLTARGVLFFWAVYGLCHALVRLSLSSALSLDESRAAELVEPLAFGYEARQPPLYEWLLWMSQQLFGRGIASHLVLRYALIAALGYAAFAAIRGAVRDVRWAALGSLSFVGSYSAGWVFQTWGTQTLLLCIAGFVTLLAMVRYLDRPSLRTAAWLGVAMGFGLQSKFGYLLYLAALLLSVLTVPDLRRRLAHPRLLLSAAIALAIIAPYAAWLVEVRGDLAHAVATAMITTTGSHLHRAAVGLWRLAVAVPLFLLPWLAIVGALAMPLFSRPRRACGEVVDAARLATRSMGFALLLAAAGVAAFGVTNMGDRYMHAILIVAPVAVFAWIDRSEGAQKLIPRFTAAFLAIAVVILAVDFLKGVDNPLTRRAKWSESIPYAELAAALDARGLAEGTIVAPSILVAGNLQALLPHARVTSTASFRVLPRPRRPAYDLSCIVVVLADQAPPDLAGPQRLELTGPPSILGAPRVSVFWWATLDPRSPSCE
jgi:hypothetical protein